MDSDIRILHLLTFNVTTLLLSKSCKLLLLLHCTVLFIGITSCQSNTEKEIEQLPDYLMAEQELIPILIDIHLAEVAHQNWRYSRTKDTLPQTDSISMPDYYQTIFDLHEISPSQFSETFAYYESHPAQFDVLYTKVVEQLSRLETKIQAQVPKIREIKAPTKSVRKPDVIKEGK